MFFSFDLVYADNPYISSFSVSPTNISSGQLISLSFSGLNTYGYNLYYPCVSGIKIKNQEGTVISCGAKVSISNLSSDSIGLFVINTSGSNKPVNFYIYPKYDTGAEYSDGVKSQSIYVGTSPYPINAVYSNSTSTISGKETIIYWSSGDLDGVNMILSCINGISATSSVEGGNIVLPCGNIAFNNKLSGSGSISLLFKNTNNDRTTVNLNVLPYIGDNSYDLSHSQSINLEVASDKTLPSQLLSFISSKPSISSDDNISLSWTTRYANGVNIKADCTESLAFSLVLSTSTQPVPCNSFLSSNSFGPNASTTLTIYNISKQIKTAILTLFPELSGGGYDGVNIKKIYIPVYPKGEVVLLQNTNANSQSISNTVQNTSITFSENSSSPRKKFYKALKLGSRGDDVSALQEYLKQFSDIYPEGLVTGYMGPATVRAIQKFQIKYNIAKSGSAGYGLVGPATRAKLNSL